MPIVHPVRASVPKPAWTVLPVVRSPVMYRFAPVIWEPSPLREYTIEVAVAPVMEDVPYPTVVSDTTLLAVKAIEPPEPAVTMTRPRASCLNPIMDLSTSLWLWPLSDRSGWSITLAARS